MRTPLLITLLLVIAAAVTVTSLWLRSEDTLHASVIITTRGAIIVPAYVERSDPLRPEAAQALLDQPMGVVISHLGQPHASEGDTSCWWSLVGTDAGPRHLRIDARNGIATRVVILTDKAVEQTVWER